MTSKFFFITFFVCILGAQYSWVQLKQSMIADGIIVDQEDLDSISESMDEDLTTEVTSTQEYEEILEDELEIILEEQLEDEDILTIDEDDDPADFDDFDDFI